MIPTLLCSGALFLKIIEVILVMSTSANTAPTFDLKPPEHYFNNPETISLLTAALTGDTAKAEECVAKGANPNDEGPKTSVYYRLRLLHYAIAAKNPEAVRTLLNVGADPELAAMGFGAAFQFVMTLEDTEMLNFLLDLRPIGTLSEVTIKRMMFDLVVQPRPACLDLLLTHGAPIDCPDDADYTIMMRAVDAQDYELAQWLVSRGASLNVEAYDGVTPAYSVEFHLKKYEVGSSAHYKVLRLKELMQERGAMFPPLSPAQVRANRENKEFLSLYQH